MSDGGGDGAGGCALLISGLMALPLLQLVWDWLTGTLVF